MAGDKKWVSVVSRLNRLTQEGKISWSQHEPSPSVPGLSSLQVVRGFYGTNFLDKNIGIFLRTVGLSAAEDAAPSSVGLAFFDEKWMFEWEVPSVSGLKELYHSVTYKAAGVDGWLEKFIQEPQQREQAVS